MNCRRCKTENPETSRYCSACGALLPRAPVKPRPTVAWPTYALGSVLVLLVAAYFFVPGVRPRSRGAAPGPPAASTAREAGTAPSGVTGEAGDGSSLAITAGRFSLDMTAPGAPAAVESAILGGSWAALPLWAFFGPGAPRLSGQGPSEILPALADWSSPDPLVLCRFDFESDLNTAPLAAYDGSMGLEWRPLKGERTSLAIEPGPLRSAGSFKAFALFRAIEAPGVLVQQGSIVGWTFGEGVSCGYLWSPADGGAPRAALPLRELLSAARSSSREAAFVQALSLGAETADDLRLEALAAGFRGPSRLIREDLPPFLRPAAVADAMASLTTSMVEQGRAAEAARILEPGVLAAAAEVPLVKAAAAAYEAARGFDAAHRLLSDLRREPVFQASSFPGTLEGIEVELAKSALRRILNERGFGGLEIYEEAVRLAPADEELRLLGVEAAILEKKWTRAEEILRAGGTPPGEVSDKVRTLERLVEEGRREEDSVTIRFNPGDKLIPVYAFLNKTHKQKFFIDTGSTSSVIPAAAVSALGIRIDDSTPVVGIQGVAGADLAYKVQIESIEIEGLVAHNIEAIVYDLGLEESAGLLGNDFLRSFQVDLDNVKGILKLRKK